MTDSFYPMIFKRKSFHLFRNLRDECLTEAELSEIKEAYASFDALCPDIKTAIRIVPASQVHSKTGAEYSILIYSEKKDNYLLNAGYLGEQLDLWLVEHNIGSLWNAVGKPDMETYDGLDYVIMIYIRKVSDESHFRKDMYKARRKELSEIWEGETPDYADIVRFSPSANNSQPWRVKNDGKTLTVTRFTKDGRSGLMPNETARSQNRLDIGIFMCILEICMIKNGVTFERTLFTDGGTEKFAKTAEYALKNS